MRNCLPESLFSYNQGLSKGGRGGGGLHRPILKKCCGFFHSKIVLTLKEMFVLDNIALVSIVATR